MKSKQIPSALFLFLVSSLILPSSANAQQKDWTGKCVMPGTDVATIQGFECLFYNLLQIIVVIAGLAFMFMFISGGFQYLLSSGDGKKVAAASSTLTMSIVGLIGVIASVLILKLISNFTGVDVTQFIIPG